MSGGELRNLTDEGLIERFQNTKDGACFAEIFRRHKRTINRRCLAVLRDGAAAEDLTQDTFVTAFTKIDLFRGGTFYSWLCTIARHLCLNHLKSAGVARDATHRPDEVPGTTKSAREARTADDVHAALKELSPPQRTCLKLFYMEGYTYREIAKLTGYSGKEVKTHLQNGRRRFELVWESIQNGVQAP
jgi:RNA polymerase sigma-70 factor (ECF subfamily)